MKRCVLFALFLAVGAASFAEGIDSLEIHEPKTSDAFLYAFWDGTLRGIIPEYWTENPPRYPEIKKRYEVLKQKENNRSDMPFLVQAKTDYHWDSKKILIASTVDWEGVVTFTFFLPAIIDRYRELGGPQQLERYRLFQTEMITETMYALERRDRLAEETYPVSLVNVESQAWDSTCKYTMDPLALKHGLRFTPDQDTLYQIWVRANRNTARNPAWHQAILNWMHREQ